MELQDIDSEIERFISEKGRKPVVIVTDQEHYEKILGVYSPSPDVPGYILQYKEYRVIRSQDIGGSIELF